MSESPEMVVVDIFSVEKGKLAETSRTSSRR
jgi:hypothetical protein